MYVFELLEDKKEILEKAITTTLEQLASQEENAQEPSQKINIEEAVEAAVNSRLCDLQDLLDISKYIQ